jgi:hypothetical protein
MSRLMTRRIFAKLSSATAGLAVAPILVASAGAVNAGTRPSARDGGSSAPAPPDDQLRSEFLLHLVIETGPVHTIGSAGLTRVVVPVTGGTFEGP